jgi:hypothetical protein
LQEQYHIEQNYKVSYHRIHNQNPFAHFRHNIYSGSMQNIHGLQIRLELGASIVDYNGPFRPWNVSRRSELVRRSLDLRKNMQRACSATF